VRALVGEDELKMLRALRRGLEQEGYAVDTAADGDEGLYLATENAYDAIVLDVMLPGIDGFEVCRRLREGGRWAPVLMLTARDAVGDPPGRRPGRRGSRVGASHVVLIERVVQSP
jgi:two-component system, OmpR family, response regulator